MKIAREEYLSKLVAARGDGFVKVITGIRRCGKSYLLFTLFKEYLIDKGVKPGNKDNNNVALWCGAADECGWG